MCEGASVACNTATYNQNGGVASATVSFNLPSSSAVRYIRVKSGGGQLAFSICATASASNNECISATPLTLYEPGSCTPTEASTALATNSSASCFTSSSTIRDVWYAVTGGPGGVATISLTPGTAGGTRGVQVFASCGGAQTYCEYGAGNTYTFTIPNGQTHYVKVFFTTPGTFSICALAQQTGSCPSPLLLNARVLLEGPFDTATGMLKDDLRAAGLVPLVEPYTALGYAHVGGGGESLQAAQLQVTGNDAVVDWVVLELRSATDPGRRIATRCGLLQRDGDVRDVDNLSPLAFCAAPEDYFVVVRHRNHLGIMTGQPIAMSGLVSLDLTAPGTATWRTDSRKSVGALMLMWAGDVTFDGNVKYTGSGNDRDPILVRVGSTAPNNTISGYLPEDVNLDGDTRYTGSGNDRDNVLVNVGGTTPNAVRSAHLPQDTLALHTRVHVVDSTVWVLNTAASDMVDYSTLIYSFVGANPDVLADDIVVGITGDGYMRKVTSVSIAADSMTLQTTQASLADIFSSGAMVLTADSSGAPPAQSFAGGGVDDGCFNGPSFQLPGWHIDFSGMEFCFDPTFNVSPLFGPDGLEGVEFALRDVVGTVHGPLVISASAGVLDESGTLKMNLLKWRNTVDIWVPVFGVPMRIPIIIVTELNAVTEVSLNCQAAVTATLPVDWEAGYDVIGAEYDGNWRNITKEHEFIDEPGGLMLSNPAVEFAVGGSFGLEVSSKIAGMLGPSVSLRCDLDATSAYGLGEPDWNYEVTDSLVLEIGMHAAFLDAFSASATYDSKWPLARIAAPDTMIVLSGNDQVGAFAAPLPQPVQVSVLKVYKPVLGPEVPSGVSDVRVRFVVTAGGGSVSDALVETDAQGVAEVVWTLGPYGDQRLKVFVLLANGDTLEGSPIEFNATILGCMDETTVTDVDGNVYPVVSIGAQCWMAENLRTAHYRDGTAIPNATVSAGPAWCNYNNDPMNDTLYGKLYNWYAAGNANICPLGWHLPTLSEWSALINYLGGHNLAGAKLRVPSWYGGTNETGFSALPGGTQLYAVEYLNGPFETPNYPYFAYSASFNSQFSGLGNTSTWWLRSTAVGSPPDWYATLSGGNPGSSYQYLDESPPNTGGIPITNQSMFTTMSEMNGRCIRCIRD